MWGDQDWEDADDITENDDETMFQIIAWLAQLAIAAFVVMFVLPPVLQWFWGFLQYAVPH